MKGVFTGTIVVVWGLLLLCSFPLYTTADLVDWEIDDCFNISYAYQMPLNFTKEVNPNNASDFILTEPKTNSSITTLIRHLFNTLTSAPSPWAYNLAVGFPTDSFFLVQACRQNYVAACNYVSPDSLFAIVVSYPYFNDYKLRYFRVGDRSGNFYFNLANATKASTTDFHVSGRPWFNTTNGWSDLYGFTLSGTLSRSFVLQPYPSTGARVTSQRLPDEPCSSCLSKTPLATLTNYFSNDAPFQDWIGVKNLTKIQSIFKWMFLRYMGPWQIQSSINLLGFGLDNNDFYSVSDCYGTPTNESIPECYSGFGYYAEVRNTAYFGDDHVYAFNFTSVNGDTANVARDEGLSFNTTGRPWYALREGWSEKYSFFRDGASPDAIYSRTYARWFWGGVILADLNPGARCLSRETLVSSAGSGRSSFVMSVLSFWS